MLHGKRVTLRALERDDLAQLWAFNNDLAVELAGGGDPPMPQSFARVQADFDNRTGAGGRDDAGFAVEADGKLIGQCALFDFDPVARTCELGITIGDKAYWGRGYGRRSSRPAPALRLPLPQSTQSLSPRPRPQCARWPHTAPAVLLRRGRLREHVWSDRRTMTCWSWASLLREWQATLDD
ncbi:MAG: GNAT family N-acetyltransferase [Caldilineaceae bacterium]|nr:GNAT family N-acetyltransferase [Caldilineaceae bacterium]